jgi:hypothetical protein
MTRIKLPLDLKVWATKIAKRSGTNKARVALARKLAVILYSILAHWRTVPLEPARDSRLRSSNISVPQQRYGELALRGEGAGYSAGSRRAAEGNLHEPVVDIGEPALRTG